MKLNFQNQYIKKAIFEIKLWDNDLFWVEDKLWYASAKSLSDARSQLYELLYENFSSSELEDIFKDNFVQVHKWLIQKYLKTVRKLVDEWRLDDDLHYDIEVVKSDWYIFRECIAELAKDWFKANSDNSSFRLRVKEILGEKWLLI